MFVKCISSTFEHIVHTKNTLFPVSHRIQTFLSHVDTSSSVSILIDDVIEINDV